MVPLTNPQSQHPLSDDDQKISLPSPSNSALNLQKDPLEKKITLALSSSYLILKNIFGIPSLDLKILTQ